MLSITAQKRDPKHSLDALRKSGLVPAVVYGRKETTVVSVNGIGESKDTLIHDVQIHPVSGSIIHADFYALEKGKKVELNIPLTFGQSPAEKNGLIVVKSLYEIEIKVAPHEIPHTLTVDLSSLVNVGDHLTATQIPLPKSAELITAADEIVASVTEFKEEKVEVTPASGPVEGGVAAPATAQKNDAKEE